MPHSSKSPAKCALCGAEEPRPGTFPTVVGVGRVCLTDGMGVVRCDACGVEVKRVTSAVLQGRVLCLADYLREVEKYRPHVLKSYDEDDLPAVEILTRAYNDAPKGYTLLAVRRGRNSTHVWEAEYEKSEVFQMRCS